MSTPRERTVVSRRCKGCGERFSVTGDTIAADLARGLSEPARCTSCRKSHGAYINAVGSGYFLEQRRRIAHPRCEGKFGLASLEHPEPEIESKKYSLDPTPAQLEKFKILEPAVQKLIRNLEDPRGTKMSILVGPTGTGKSVWAPTQILRSSIGREGRICVTQPRLVTLRSAKGKSDASTTPGYVATSLLGADAVGAGQEVGMLYRGESSKSDRYTRLLYVTDGVLIRWILSGQLGRYSVLMIDEAHEQSPNMEEIFALLRYHLPLYPRLRLVIMSATMDVDRFTNFFGDGRPNTVFVAAPDQPATLCKIHDRWPDGPDGYAAKVQGSVIVEQAGDTPAAVATVVKAIREKSTFTVLGNPRGDILCFAPTVRLVDETVRAVQSLNLSGLEVLPCYSDMDDEDVASLQRSEVRARAAMERGQNTIPQRVIVATNYAETSVTFSNLRYVIDSGMIVEPSWDPATCSKEYPVRRHSQAGCTQRKGRVGRVQDGEVFRLYTKVAFEDPTIFPKNPRAAIAGEPYEKFLLAAQAAGVSTLKGYRWLGFDENDGRQRDELARSLAGLQRHGVVDADGDITLRGLELEGIQHASLDWSRAMAESDGMACSLEVATFLSFSELRRPPFLKNENGLLAYARWREGCVDDLEFYLRLFHHWSEARSTRSPEQHAAWSEREGLNHRAFRDVERARAAGLSGFTKRTHTDPTARALDLARVERVRLVLMRALYPWVYVRSQDGDGSYAPLQPELCPCKAKLAVDRESACAESETLEAFLCVSRKTLRDKVYASDIVRINPKWLEVGRAQSPVGVALLCATSRSEKADNDAHREPWETGAAQRITSAAERPLAPSSFVKGAPVNFRVLRFQRGNGPHTVLAMEQSTGKPVVISFDGGTLKPGDVARGHVTESVNAGMLGVSQSRIVKGYAPEALIPTSHTKLVKELPDTADSQRPAGHLLELEPGVIGSLKPHSSRIFECYWADYLSGRISTLRVVANNGRILLGLQLPEPAVGTTFRGMAQELKYDSQNRLLGLRVLFSPGRLGMVFWRTASQRHLEMYHPNDEVYVRLIAARPNDRGHMLYDLEFTQRPGY